MNESQGWSVAGELAGMLTRLTELPALLEDDAARIDVIAGLERLRAAVAAAQARVTEEFAVSQEAANRALGLEARVARQGVPEQVGLARRVSPASASRQVSQAKALVRELPRTLELLRAGEVSELVAVLVVNETGVLSADDRRTADERIAAQLPGLGSKRALAVSRRTVIELDQQAVVARAAKARQDRRVSCRPAPDTMAVLSALLPCEDGVRAYAALRAQADSLRAAGDERSRDQIMADTLAERITGRSPADGGTVEIGLVMTDTTLFGKAETPAEMNGYGPIPGAVARDVIGRQPQRQRRRRRRRAWVCVRSRAAHVFLRRLLTDPITGVVTQVESRRRRFTGPSRPTCSTATGSAALRSVRRRSGTWTTSDRTPPVDRPVPATGEACVSGATTSTSCPAGPPGSSMLTDTSSKPPPRQDTPTDPIHHRCLVTRDHTSHRG